VSFKIPNSKLKSRILKSNKKNVEISAQNKLSCHIVNRNCIKSIFLFSGPARRLVFKPYHSVVLVRRRYTQVVAFVAGVYNH